MSESVPITDLPLGSGGPASETDALRESVTTMALCGRSFADVEAILAEVRDERETSLQNDYEQRIFAAKARIDEAEKQIRDIDAAVEQAKRAAVQQVDLDHNRRMAERRLEELRDDIARKRAALERQHHSAAVEDAARRLRDSEERLSEQKKVKLAEQMASWQRQRDEDLKRAATEEKLLAETEEALAAARERVKPLLEQRITKTVAGFLLWVGYGSFAAIGATLALLLPKLGSEQSPLSQHYSCSHGRRQLRKRPAAVGDARMEHRLRAPPRHRVRNHHLAE